MTTAVAEQSQSGSVVRMTDWRDNRANAIRVLQASLYPGAKEQSVEMVLGYCEAANLDPFQKPVHIVPMSVKTGKQNNYGDDIYEIIDQVLPGIGLYRVQASRTGQYAGMDDPVFGPMLKLNYKKKVTEWVKGPNDTKAKPKDKYVDAFIEYPEWVKVVVYRLVEGVRCPFPSVEYWTENYATAGNNTDAPNRMWAKRPRAQLVKCCEAQALRKGFPEVGSQPTAEEMEGRIVDVDDVRTIAPEEAETLMPSSTEGRVEATDAEIVGNKGTPETAAQKEAPPPDATDVKLVTPNMLLVLRKKAANNKVTEEEVCHHFNIASLDKLPATKINDAMTFAGNAK